MQLLFGTPVCQTKSKIFACLFFNGRLNTHASLASRNIIDETVCPWCLQHRRPISLVLSVLLQSGGMERYQIVCLLLADRRPQISSIWSSILLTVLWKIWEGRNHHLFQEKAFYLTCHKLHYKKIKPLADC
jgi:hypothetical protein